MTNRQTDRRSLKSRMLIPYAVTNISDFISSRCLSFIKQIEVSNKHDLCPLDSEFIKYHPIAEENKCRMETLYWKQLMLEWTRIRLLGLKMKKLRKFFNISAAPSLLDFFSPDTAQLKVSPKNSGAIKLHLTNLI